MLLRLGIVALFAFALGADAPDSLSGAKCPISGKPASADHAVAYKGGQVYFCCGGCPGAFSKNPEKYAAKANQQLVVTGQARQVGCPLTGKGVSKTIDVCGVDVGFCCGGCTGKVEKLTPEEQLDMVFGKGFEKGFRVTE